jgi:hypothetical protein
VPASSGVSTCNLASIKVGIVVRVGSMEFPAFALNRRLLQLGDPAA